MDGVHLRGERSPGEQNRGRFEFALSQRLAGECGQFPAQGYLDAVQLAAGRRSLGPRFFYRDAPRFLFFGLALAPAAEIVDVARVRLGFGRRLGIPSLQQLVAARAPLLGELAGMPVEGGFHGGRSAFSINFEEGGRQKQEQGVALRLSQAPQTLDQAEQKFAGAFQGRHQRQDLRDGAQDEGVGIGGDPLAGLERVGGPPIGDARHGPVGGLVE